MKIVRSGNDRIEVIEHDFLLGIFMTLFGMGVSFGGYTKYSGGQVGGLESLTPAGALALMAVGAVLVASGILMCRRRDLVLDRTRGEMQWRSSGLLGARSRKVPFSQIGRAYVEYHPFKGAVFGRDSASRLAVQLTNGKLPFSEVYQQNSTVACERAVNAINDFIDHRPER